MIGEVKIIAYALLVITNACCILYNLSGIQEIG